MASSAPRQGLAFVYDPIAVRQRIYDEKAYAAALDQDTTAQDLAEEAIRDVLRRHGRG